MSTVEELCCSNHKTKRNGKYTRTSQCRRAPERQACSTIPSQRRERLPGDRLPGDRLLGGDRLPGDLLPGDRLPGDLPGDRDLWSEETLGGVKALPLADT